MNFCSSKLSATGNVWLEFVVTLNFAAIPQFSADAIDAVNSGVDTIFRQVSLELLGTWVSRVR